METATSTTYCRVCGMDASDRSICENCGCEPYNGNEYCDNCGSSTLPQAVKCVKCGNRFRISSVQENKHLDNKLDMLGIAASIAVITGYVLPWFDFDNIKIHGYDMHEVIQWVQGKWTDQERGWFQLLSLVFIPGFSLVILIYKLFNEKLNANLSYILKFVIVLSTILLFMIPLSNDDKILNHISIGFVLSTIGAMFFSYDAYTNDLKGRSNYLVLTGKQSKVQRFSNGKALKTDIIKIADRKRRNLLIGIGLMLLLIVGFLGVTYLNQKSKGNPVVDSQRNAESPVVVSTDTSTSLPVQASANNYGQFPLSERYYNISDMGLGPVNYTMSEQKILDSIPGSRVEIEPNPEKYLLNGNGVKAVYVGAEKLFVFKSLPNEDLVIVTDNPKYKTYDGLHVGATQREVLDKIPGEAKTEDNKRFEGSKVYTHWLYRTANTLVFEDRLNNNDFSLLKTDGPDKINLYKMSPSENPIKLIVVNGSDYGLLEEKQFASNSNYNDASSSSESDFSGSASAESFRFTDKQSVYSYLQGKTFYSSDGSAKVSIGNTIRINGQETHFNLSVGVLSPTTAIVKGESLSNPDGTLTIYVYPEKGCIYNSGDQYCLK